MNYDLPIEYEREPDVQAWRKAKLLQKSDPGGALENMRTLAAQGSLLSIIEMGRAFALGIGTPKDDIEAERWFRRAAAARSVRGHYFLGRLLLRMRRYKEAAEAFSFSAARGYSPALHDLGKIYFLGLGVEKNITLAERYLCQASESGSVFARKLYSRLVIETARDYRRKLYGYYLGLSAFFCGITTMVRYGVDSERLFP